MLILFIIFAAGFSLNRKTIINIIIRNRHDSTQKVYKLV